MVQTRSAVGAGRPTAAEPAGPCGEGGRFCKPDTAFLQPTPYCAVLRITRLSLERRVPRKFLALSVITINCFLGVFMSPGGHPWSWRTAFPAAGEFRAWIPSSLE